STDPTDLRFPLCICDGPRAKDLVAAVVIKTLAGKVDRAGGLAVRLKDKDNYYVARVNALEDNVRFYKVEGGKRRQLGGKDYKVPSEGWGELKVVASGKRFEVWFCREKLFELDDETFPDAGKVALWTK